MMEMIKDNMTPGKKILFKWSWPKAVALLLCLPFSLELFSQDNQPQKESREETIATIGNNFKNPGKAFQTAPLWVWNTKVTKGLIDSMLTGFKANAFGGAFVHPRPGLVTEYLGDDWLSLYKYAVQKAKQLNLNLWIYDECSYPSGFAGGLVPDRMPESYNQGQMLQLFQSDTLPADAGNFFICLKKEGDAFKDITNAITGYKNSRGPYYLFRKQSYAKQAGTVGPPNYPMTDLLVKGVTEKFIDITFSGYKKMFGDEFGKTIPGSFSDEPGIPTHGRNTTRWTPDLFAYFKQKWGYDLVPCLPSLFEETGDWKKVRHNYQATLLQMFIDRWSKPMHAFMEKNHLKWTGHYWEHGWPDPGEGPDNMAMYAWHQQPGIDMLFNQFDETSPNAQFGNIRSVKELASVANQLNKERTLCETYGGAGWDLSFKDMKRLGDWEFALGVNFMNQHLSWMSMAGARKYDYPTTFSYQNSWWPYFKPLNEYFARLSYALSRGRQKNDILILEPTSTAWMYAAHDRKNSRFYEIGRNFQAFITRLEKCQVEYDLGSEDIIKDHAKVEGSRLRVGEAAYRTIIIPPGMENINGNTYALLKQYLANGGKLMMFEKLTRVDGREIQDQEVLAANGKNIVYYPGISNLCMDKDLAATGLNITVTATGDEGGGLYHHRRMLSEGQLLFFANANLAMPATCRVAVKGGKQVLWMDLHSGRILQYPQNAGLSDSLVFNVDLPAAGSALFLIANGNVKADGKYQAAKAGSPIAGSAIQVFRPKENTLMVDFCDIRVKGLEKKDIHVREATNLAFTQNGFSRDPWQHQMQFKQEIVQKDHFSPGTGFSVSYHFNIADHVDVSNFRAVVEQGRLWSSITVNGHAIAPGNNWWLDYSFTALEVGKFLQKGDNTISLTIDPMSVFAETGPLYLLGNFNLESDIKGWKIVAPRAMTAGSWRKQGLPMYGHEVVYQKEYSLSAPPSGKYFLQLDSVKGSVAAIRVNGINTGIVYTDPFMADISAYLKKGKNRVEVRVVGSLRNLMGPHYNTYRKGYTGPDSWDNIPTYPAGGKYILFDYGLDDFTLYHSR